MYAKMMDKVITKFGLEDARTIDFCELCACAGQTAEGQEAVRDDFEALMREGVFTEER